MFWEGLYKQFMHFQIINRCLQQVLKAEIKYNVHAMARGLTALQWLLSPLLKNKLIQTAIESDNST